MPGPVADARTELEWLAFFLPRQAVQALARRVPLAALRDRLPRPVAERLRFGLYPARITDPAAGRVPPALRAWGDPAALDPARPVRYDAPPRASILLVTYGNLALTRLCLASLQRAAAATPFEIIAVDNGSRDGTPEHLAEVAASGLLPLRALASATNLGFAAANNRAARLARGDVLVFLNNDTVVTPGWLDRLVAHLDGDRALGLIGPTTNSCGNEAEVPIPYRDLDGMFDFAARAAAADTARLADIAMLTLFCAAMPRALFDAVGGLDEGYGIGLFEDDDLSIAVRRRGRAVRLARDVFVHHFGGAAFSRLPPAEYLRVWWENRRRYERKWGERWRPR